MALDGILLLSRHFAVLFAEGTAGIAPNPLSSPYPGSDKLQGGGW